MPLPARWLLHATIAALQAGAEMLDTQAGWLLEAVQDVGRFL